MQRFFIVYNQESTQAHANIPPSQIMTFVYINIYRFSVVCSFSSKYFQKPTKIYLKIEHLLWNFV